MFKFSIDVYPTHTLGFLFILQITIQNIAQEESYTRKKTNNMRRFEHDERSKSKTIERQVKTK
jgi:hypothetical protein